MDEFNCKLCEDVGWIYMNEGDIAASVPCVDCLAGMKC